MNRRKFLITSASMISLTSLGNRSYGETPLAPSRYVLSEVGCGRATGYAEANKMVSAHGKTHVAFLDSPPEGFRVRIRTLDHATGTWSPSYTIGEAFDNHGGPALAIDSQGYLHVAYYPHHHPMRYKKSLRPHDASEWGEAEEFGEHLTYPTLVVDDADTLYVTCRLRNWIDPWRTVLYTRKRDGAWVGPHPILQAEESGYAHFMDALAWSPDKKTLHLATRLHDGNPPGAHTVGYLRSDDQGVTWAHYDGTPVSLPATAKTIDIIAQREDRAKARLRIGGLAVAPDGRPFILYSENNTHPADAWIAYPDEHGDWTERSLREFMPEEYAGGHLFTPGGITFNEKGLLFVVLSATKPAAVAAGTGWGESYTEVIGFASENLGETFSSTVLSTPDDQVPNWLPNMERPTGHNVVSGTPSIIYTEGGPGSENTELLANTVHWVRF